MPSQSMTLVVESCLAHAESLPIRRRAALYRALAEFCGVPNQSADLRAIASDLETADHRCREFAFRFSVGAKEEAGS